MDASKYAYKFLSITEIPTHNCLIVHPIHDLFYNTHNTYHSAVHYNPNIQIGSSNQPKPNSFPWTCSNNKKKEEKVPRGAVSLL